MPVVMEQEEPEGLRPRRDGKNSKLARSKSALPGQNNARLCQELLIWTRKRVDDCARKQKVDGAPKPSLAGEASGSFAAAERRAAHSGHVDGRFLVSDVGRGLGRLLF